MIESTGHSFFQTGSVAARWILLAVLMAGCCVTASGWQEEPQANLEAAVRTARQLLHDDLETLATFEQQQQRTGQAAEARRWIIPRDPQRQYIFLPPAASGSPAAGATESQQEFSRRLNKIRGTYASTLFDLAKRYAETERGSQAYQLFHELLVYDPDHEATRKLLGFRKDRQNHWVRPRNRQTTARLSGKRQPTIRWEKGTHWKITSPHFEVYSAGGRDDGLALARELEITYQVWRQVFFDYWSSNARLKGWLSGKGADGDGSRQYEIIAFRDREHYLADLADVPNVQGSSGYYDEKKAASFFYNDEVPPVSSWRHETIHQLLQENSRTPPGKSVAGKGHAWLVEGVALYFESMRVHDHYVTLGGFDALRLQYARLRSKREGFYVPMAELDAMDRSELQKHPDVGKLYSQAAGISHFLFTARQGRYRQAYIEFIRQFYQGRKVKGSLEESTVPFEQMDRQYAEFLNVNPKQLAEFFLNRNTTGLALGRGGLKSADVQSLAECTSLEWLELSENPLGDRAIEHLTGLTNLRQLFLDVTAITDAASIPVSQMVQLQELDLASTRISDAGVSRLTSLTNLQVLWLAGCKVSDASVDSIAALPNLQLVDLRKTLVSDAGIAKLKRARPSLQIMH